MMPILLPEMTHEEWLAWRQTGIGASDAPIILKKSPYKTRRQLWEEKVFGSQQKETSSMAAGKKYEGKALAHFNQVMKLNLKPANLQHEHRFWMYASMDGYDADARCSVEIKLANKEDHGIAEKGNVPEKYYPQLQHQMEVTQLTDNFYMSYQIKDDEIYNPIIIPIRKDTDFIKMMVEHEKDFYESIRQCTPPAFDERDFLPPEAFCDDEQLLKWKELEEEFLDKKNLAEHFSLLAAEAREKLIELSCGHNVKGSQLRIEKVKSKGRIDFELALGRLKEFCGYPEEFKDLEQYRKPPSEKWYFRDISEKEIS